MRLRNVKNAKEINKNSKYFLPYEDAYKAKGNFATKIFNNNNPIHLEIGMGKGQFLIQMAKENPNINFVGLEKYESIICRAVEKLDKEDLSNIKLIKGYAEGLYNIFDHEIDTIYLNFSDPWPKKRHAKRRLTSHVFLPIYDKIFKGDKIIIQKTDNIILFGYSLSSLSTYGYTLEEVSLDLHSEDIPNVKTEYEEKFSGQGYKINYLKARKK